MACIHVYIISDRVVTVRFGVSTGSGPPYVLRSFPAGKASWIQTTGSGRMFPETSGKKKEAEEKKIKKLKKKIQ